MRDAKPAIPAQQAPSEKKTFKRRRCQNCNKLYMPSREDQKFCRDLPDPDKCRKEFYRYGSSYGPLKTGLHKVIDKKYAELRKAFMREIADQSRRIDRVEAALLKLQTAHEDHTHEVHSYTDYGQDRLATGAPKPTVEQVESERRSR